MDNDYDSPIRPQNSAFATPLLISMAGMIATTLAIVTYHFLLVRYCIRRRSRNPAVADNNIRRSLPIQTPNSPQIHLPEGVEAEILKKIPILSFSAAACGDDNECVVCLGELEDGDTVRLLPNCKHVFHLSCIDNWFRAHSNCPVCRAPVVPEITDRDPTSIIPNSGDVQTQCRDNGGSSSSGSREIVCTQNDIIDDQTGLLRHCVSFVLPRTPLRTELKRSLSLDQSYIVINVGGGGNGNVEKGNFSRIWGSYKGQQQQMRSHLERNRLSLLKSFSQIQIGVVRTGN